MLKILTLTPHRLLILVFVFVLSALYFARVHPPIASTDTYYHLSIGRQVAATHQIPKTDTFTFVAAGREFISGEWLSGLIFYTIFNQWQETGILALRIFIGTAVLFFLYQTMRLLAIRFELIVLFLLANTFTLGLRMIDRPEMFSFLLFSILIYLITIYNSQRGDSLRKQGVSSTLLLFLVVPIFLIWPNIQGYSPLGLLTLAYGLFANSLQTQNYQNLTGAIKTNKLPLAIFLLSTLAATATADQFRRFFYVFFLNRDLFGYVIEVQSIFNKLAAIKYNFWANIPVEIYIFAVVSLIGLISFRFKVYPQAQSSASKSLVLLLDLGYFLLLLALAVLFIRFIPVFILLSTPLVARNLSVSRIFPKFLPKMAIAILILMITISIFEKSILGDRTNMLFATDKAGQPVVATARTWKSRQPTAALEFIRQNLNSQKLLTSLNWSNQVVWELPNTKVFADIIYEKQTRQSLEDLQNLSRGQSDWPHLLDKYQPDTIINTQPFNLVSFFEVPIWQIKDWKLVYVDDVAVVYTKLAIAENLGLSAIHPEYASDFKFTEEEKDLAKKELEKLINLNPNNSFAYSQLILTGLLENDHQSAQNLTRVAKSKFKNDPNFYLLEATIKVAKKDCSGAAGALSSAKRLTRGYFFLLEKVQTLAAQCSLKI